MDTAVALVQAYLHINGYFTVTEYPIVRGSESSGVQTVTDLDILAFRFPHAGCAADTVKGAAESPAISLTLDPTLGAKAECADMIIGEVKEGHARFNPATRDAGVLATALGRFGCCSPEHVESVVERLLAKGVATTRDGHRVRMVAFGAAAGPRRERAGLVVPLTHVIDFVRDHLEKHWSSLGHAQFKHPVLSLMTILEKAGMRPRARPSKLPEGRRRPR